MAPSFPSRVEQDQHDTLVHDTQRNLLGNLMFESTVETRKTIKLIESICLNSHLQIE